MFASLSLLLVASFFLTLLEAARVKGLDAYGQMQRINAIESVFSEYDRELFEQYGIFLLDGSYGSETIQFSQINARLQSVSQQNLSPMSPSVAWQHTQNFYRMDVPNVSVTGYLLATDYEGAPFRQMAAASMKARYPAELAEKLYAGLQSAEHAMTRAHESQAMMGEAQEQIRVAKEEQVRLAKEQEETGEPQETLQPGAYVENPMDVVKSFKAVDCLTLVMPPERSVSSKSIQGKDALEHRSLLQGNVPWQKTGGWYETVLYQQFLQTQFCCYGSENSRQGALDYELEYIQAGKQTDRENLKSVVRQLLLLREGANFIYLQTDVQKQQEAFSVATALAAAVGIAPAAGVIAEGILAAWAYVESILDVRTLLAGGKIAWMKTAGSWSSSLSGLGGLLAGNTRAKEQEYGENYQDYLQKLLYLKSERILNYRAMDLIELDTGSKHPGSRRMDAMILALRADFTYEAEPVFFKMVTLQNMQVDRWEFAESVYYSYFLKE